VRERWVGGERSSWKLNSQVGESHPCNQNGWKLNSRRMKFFAQHKLYTYTHHYIHMMQPHAHRLLARLDALLARIPPDSSGIKCNDFWNCEMIEGLIEQRFVANANAITENEFAPGIRTAFEFDPAINFRDAAHDTDHRMKFSLTLSDLFCIITSIVELSIRQYESLLSVHLEIGEIIPLSGPLEFSSNPDSVELEEANKARNVRYRFEAAKKTYSEAIAYFCRSGTPFQLKFLDIQARVLEMMDDIFKQFEPKRSTNGALIYAFDAYDCIRSPQDGLISMVDAILAHKHADIMSIKEVIKWSALIPNIYQILSQDETAIMTLFDNMMETAFVAACFRRK
jgi:hypothetical protein